MKTQSIYTRTNIGISTLIVACICAQLAAIARGHDNAGLLPAVAVLIPLNVPLWSLIHEAVHRHFCEGARKNEVVGRFLSVFFGIPFDVLRFGHLMHHQYNREWETELYDRHKFAPAAWVTHYSKMLGGLYISEVLAAFAIAILPLSVSRRLMGVAFADPRQREAALRSLMKDESVGRIRVDSVFIVLLYGAAAIFAGAAWPALALLICGRAMIISMHDNAYHYDTPPDNSVAAKELGCPAAIQAFMLNFNHHLSHHKDPALPWQVLAEDNRAQKRGYSETLWSALMAQFRGPIKVERPQGVALSQSDG